MLRAKYECSRPYGLTQEDFTRFPSLLPCKIGCALEEPTYDHRTIIFTIFVEDHQIMLQTKYECSSHYGLSEEDFFKDFLLCYYVK